MPHCQSELSSVICIVNILIPCNLFSNGLFRLIFQNEEAWDESVYASVGKQSVGLLSLTVSRNLFLNLATSFPKLATLVIHDCRVHISQLCLSSFPKTIKALKLSAIEVLDDTSTCLWLEVFISDVEEQRRRRSPTIRSFQFRTSYPKATSDSACLRALESVAIPYRLARKVGRRDPEVFLSCTFSDPPGTRVKSSSREAIRALRRMLEPGDKNRRKAEHEPGGTAWGVDAPAAAGPVAPSGAGADVSWGEGGAPAEPLSGAAAGGGWAPDAGSDSPGRAVPSSRPLTVATLGPRGVRDATHRCTAQFSA